MIYRNAEKTVKRLAEQFPVIAITGPRQSGKTTLAKMVFPDKKYISLDNRDARLIAQESPEDFLKAFPDGAIIDEAQKAPEIFDAIKLIVDSQNYTPGKFILTGSSQFRLKNTISESLAGRIGLITLLPFSISELNSSNILSDDPYDYAFNGFYPPLYDKKKHFNKEDWFENYIETYIDLDIKDQINPSNVHAFHKMVQLCATMSGQLVKYERLARDVGVSAVTIKSWLSILEASYIVHFLEPDSNNLGKSIVKTPKLYFVDTGLLCYFLRIESKEDLLLSPFKGAVVETMAISELKKQRFNMGKKPRLTFFRDKNGFEIDVIADWKNTCAIEVKSGSASLGSMSSQVKKYLTQRSDNPLGKVFYLGDLTCNINGIEYVSWRDWAK